MGFRIPQILQYEFRHRLERVQGRFGGWGLRTWINAHPGLAATVACLSALLLILSAVQLLRPKALDPLPRGRVAWFYDAGTGRLFRSDSRQVGPIAAPSGPLPDGTPAGYRAHVYGYVLDPNEAELFVGFLERPDPWSGQRISAAQMNDMEAWAKGRLITRVDDERWVTASSEAGQAILRELWRPNAMGQTPIYHVPK